MVRFVPTLALPLLLMTGVARALSPEETAQLPPPAAREVNFARDIQPLFEASCVKCHARGKAKGGLSIETRELLLKGGETGPGAVAGKSAESLIVEMVAGIDPDEVMPKKGKRFTPEETGLLRAWIDQGMKWPADIAFAKPPAQNLAAPAAELPPGDAPPIDRLIAAYLAEKQIPKPQPVDDAAFARRAYLDAIGLLPTAEQLRAFLDNSAPDKRAALVEQLLGDKRNYAIHWLTFWNDLLRNDYRGTGFIDGGRKQISEWLFDALVQNKPYNAFVANLVNPDRLTEGFTAGILWRGNVNAVMQPPMQAAQSVSQVFLGINLKCASCHDSFVSDWSLEDAYGMAAIFSDTPLELVHCDKPTGKKAALRFLYPEIGGIDPALGRKERMERFAQILASQQDGRLPRTIVNRLWQRLLGRGLVEPVDDMEQTAWNPKLLDWLAADFVASGYDLKHTIGVILNSEAYRFRSVETPGEKEEYLFRGPLTRRLDAEEFCDAIGSLTGRFAPLPSSIEFDLSAGGTLGAFQMPRWIWTDETLETAAKRSAWRHAKEKEDVAQAKGAEAQKAVEENAPGAEAASTVARAAAAEAADAERAAAEAREPGRHKVVFRKRFELPAKPDRAYGTVAASQSFEVRLNGNEVKSKLSDDLYNGRIRIYDFAPFLVAGENELSIRIDSHTEKQMTEQERKEFPASADHLNKISGLAFYLRARDADRITEIVSDASCRARRAPEGDWADPKLADATWAGAATLPDGTGPVDEGPGLEPIRRKDFANIPVELGQPLRAAVSTAAFAGEMRAALRAADPLQAALDRPNREIVVSVRQDAPTTLQGLELTNGATLNTIFSESSARLAASAAPDPGKWVDGAFLHAVARKPTPVERGAVLELLGSPVRPEGVADFLWALSSLPEFQFIN